MARIGHPDAVVLFSGGMDSTIALFHELNVARLVGSRVHTLSIVYGQRHARELVAADRIINMIRQDELWSPVLGHRATHLINYPPAMDGSLIGGDPVTKYQNIEDAEKRGDEDNAFVPYRNLLFLTTAAVYCVKWGAHKIVTGLRGGFPDCTHAYEMAAQTLLNQSYPQFPITIETPTHLPRGHCLAMAEGIHGCMDALALSMTCFEGTDPPCGRCLPCLKRAQGFSERGTPDPLITGRGPRSSILGPE